jgi:hypothetical protein
LFRIIIAFEGVVAAMTVGAYEKGVTASTVSELRAANSNIMSVMIPVQIAVEANVYSTAFTALLTGYY